MKEFKINDYITLKLEFNKTVIYVDKERFLQCKYLLLKLEKGNFEQYDELESIDEAAEHLDHSQEGFGSGLIKPETEFWAHCSNLQAWVENNYDTRLLHSNLSFPLLKKLSDKGDPLTNIKFQEEIAYRLESGYLSVIFFLIEQEYLQYLPLDYLNVLMEKISGTLFPQIFRILNEKKHQRNRVYSKNYIRILKKLKALINLPLVIHQIDHKDFVIGLANINFSFLDFFIHPKIENQLKYLNSLLEIFIEGLYSKDTDFFMATKNPVPVAISKIISPGVILIISLKPSYSSKAFSSSHHIES